MTNKNTNKKSKKSLSVIPSEQSESRDLLRMQDGTSVPDSSAEPALSEAEGVGMTKKDLDDRNNKNLEKIIKKIIGYLNAEATIEKDASDTLNVNISSEDSGVLIGHFGQNLADLQYILRMAANKQIGERVSLVVDVEGYKAKKNRELEELSISMAENVRKSGYPQKLRSMNAYERRIVHTALTGFDGVETISVGEEPNRYIEIKPKDK